MIIGSSAGLKLVTQMSLGGRSSHDPGRAHRCGRGAGHPDPRAGHSGCASSRAMRRRELRDRLTRRRSIPTTRGSGSSAASTTCSSPSAWGCSSPRCSGWRACSTSPRLLGARRSPRRGALSEILLAAHAAGAAVDRARLHVRRARLALRRRDRSGWRVQRAWHRESERPHPGPVRRLLALTVAALLARPALPRAHRYRDLLPSGSRASAACLVG